MESNGSTFIDRVEGIETSNNNNNILANKGKLRQNFCKSLIIKTANSEHVSGEPTRIAIQKYSNASNIDFFYT